MHRRKSWEQNSKRLETPASGPNLWLFLSLPILKVEAAKSLITFGTAEGRSPNPSLPIIQPLPNNPLGGFHAGPRLGLLLVRVWLLRLPDGARVRPDWHGTPGRGINIWIIVGASRRHRLYTSAIGSDAVDHSRIAPLQCR